MEITTKEVSNSWTKYALTNDHGMKLSVLNYGGIITELLVPDQDGTLENVVLGYKNLEDYKEDPNYFGALIGRVAGRIEGSSFTLEGQTFDLDANEGPNHLHGGANGFHQKIWEVTPFESENQIGLTLSLNVSKEEDAYPGNLEVTVTYTLTNDNELVVDYQAESDETTVLTLTNHSYFNLSGNYKRTLHNHHLTFNSPRFVELDDKLIPTGKWLDVDDTPFDFREGKDLVEGMVTPHPQNKIAKDGFDHYFILEDGQVHVEEPTSGRTLEITTNQPGMVMYTSNNLDDSFLLAERSAEKYLGLCMETQSSPASLHHDGFPSIVLNGDEPYHKRTTFSFKTQ
ncbi:aldose epimerase family protein [Halobacillus halophilus]|uniref:aldose epimerase family protein n=1 Tax=Halobacillus halophilus TaxID=1570 RepID=UPI001CD6A5D5|nr:aldose epimerase family protein [Halobacillus halophilus]MCA1010102.1 galactose mutarotase [Halobacillus halophilus]